MSIAKFKVLNPVVNHKKPYYDINKKLFIFSVKTGYKYFIEAARFNPTKGYNEYFLLLSTTKFDENCRRCEVDMYGKCKIRLSGEIKDYIISQLEDKGNFQVDYIESDDGYDVFSIV